MLYRISRQIASYGFNGYTCIVRMDEDLNFPRPTAPPYPFEFDGVEVSDKNKAAYKAVQGKYGKEKYPDSDWKLAPWDPKLWEKRFSGTASYHITRDLHNRCHGYPVASGVLLRRLAPGQWISKREDLLGVIPKELEDWMTFIVREVERWRDTATRTLPAQLP